MSTERLDSKYEVLRELSNTDGCRIVEATHPDGRPVRVEWFHISNPKSRADFHRYRSALKAVASPLLLDTVARPGAYYSVWAISQDKNANDWLNENPNDKHFRIELKTLAAKLAEHGYALTETQVVAKVLAKDGLSQMQPQLAGLNPQPEAHTIQQINELNQTFFAALPEPSNSTQEIKFSQEKNPQRDVAPLAMTAAKPAAMPPAPKPKPKLSIWGVLPGIALFGLAGFWGWGAIQNFLEPPLVSVPNVVGMELTKARDTLVAAGLTPRGIEGQDQTKPREQILTQNPAAGSSLTQSRVVEIVINYPRRLTVPSLIGRNLAEATQSLKDRFLVLGTVAKIPTQEGERKGVVVAQTPEAEKVEVTKGSKVDLVISGDPVENGKTFLPNLRGYNFELARQVVKLSRLTLVEVKEDVSKQAPGTILSQNPEPFALVSEDSDVVLHIATANNAPIPPRPSPPLVVRPQPVPAPTPPPQQITPAPTPEPTPPTPAPQQITPTPEPTPPTPEPTPPTPEPTPPTPEPTPPTPEPAPQQIEPTPAPTPKPTPTPPPVAAPETRTVDFSFTLPDDIGTASIEVRVRDENGERSVFGPAELSGGTPVQAFGESVRGQAIFIVFSNGVEIHREAR